MVVCNQAIADFGFDIADVAAMACITPMQGTARPRLDATLNPSGVVRPALLGIFEVLLLPWCASHSFHMLAELHLKYEQVLQAISNLKRRYSSKCVGMHPNTRRTCNQI